MNARTVKAGNGLRPAALALALIGGSAMAADDMDLNLVQYEFRFGQGHTQHSFYLARFAPGGRFDDLALGENGSIRIPLYSTDEKLWTLARQAASDGSGGSLAGSIANGILTLASLAAMGYALAAQAKGIGDAFDYDFNITVPNLAVPTSTASSSQAAKK